MRPNRMYEGGEPFTVLASAARAAATTFTSSVFDGEASKARGVVLYAKASAGGGSNVDVTFKVQRYKLADDSWEDVLASDGAFDSSGETLILVVHPGISATSNLSAAANLAPKWRLTATHDHAESITYSVVGFYLP